MALVAYDRVQETTTTTGTGTITLAGAVSGYQSFAVVGNSNTVYYCITSGTAWEVGIGTYTSAGTTLARTTVLSNSLGTTANISLTGTSNVFATYPAEKAVFDDGSVVKSNGTSAIWANSNTISVNATIPTNYNGVSAGPITINSGITVTVPSGSVWTIT